ncbi:dihydrodipicolinate synthase family protein [Thermomicrobium roseum]|jgi:dihydrodipicolinate synthase/N-acetylneuraminate lyase|uniref:Aldolase n=1 Tax=Thermomicrobium roseum (strain ATCC 27502 / DSM 5159 / P-2) TaxID=309801 RepID=B9L3H8_THERP|nr:dihydrodipicolinate synthase family protein [Thermomicrobium roseum]ACM06757.1 aldolase [Thermomicrobium roseum DSM 5159]MBO9404627.1 dihydrodipicolinate synthase family protein [Thermomicrobium sp.]
MAFPRIGASDLRGIMAYPPTPAKPNAGDIDARDTVDLDETERMIKQLLQDGVDSIATNGTLGEMATLTLEEWKAFASVVVETVRAHDPDFPLFIGATTLNTRDTIDRMRFLRDIGAPGVLLGRPMWSEMTAKTMIRFYQDVAEAVPDLAICVYDNTAAFRGIIPTEVYEALSRIPQVVAVKYAGGAAIGFRYHNDLQAVGDRIKLFPIECIWFFAYSLYGERVPGCWSTTATCGPEPVLYLRDVLLANDLTEGRWIAERILWAHEPFIVSRDFPEFARYNIQLERLRYEAAGYIKPGPSRPPYYMDLLPEQHVESTLEHVRRWQQVRQEVAERLKARAATTA